MVRKSRTEDYFREKFKAERQRRNWSQADVAKRLEKRGIHLHPTTVAKIEAGERSVRIDEAKGIADIFELSLDSLVGRRAGLENDLMHMLSAAVDAARNAKFQVSAIQNSLISNFNDLDILEFDGLEAVRSEATRAHKALAEAGDALENLSRFRAPQGRNGVRLRHAVVQHAATELLRRLRKDSGDETQS